jgi:hypothetical protein
MAEGLDPPPFLLEGASGGLYAARWVRGECLLNCKGFFYQKRKFN